MDDWIDSLLFDTSRVVDRRTMISHVGKLSIDTRGHLRDLMNDVINITPNLILRGVGGYNVPGIHIQTSIPRDRVIVLAAVVPLLRDGIKIHCREQLQGYERFNDDQLPFRRKGLNTLDVESFLSFLRRNVN